MDKQDSQDDRRFELLFRKIDVKINGCAFEVIDKWEPIS